MTLESYALGKGWHLLGFHFSQLISLLRLHTQQARTSDSQMPRHILKHKRKYKITVTYTPDDAGAFLPKVLNTPPHWRVHYLTSSTHKPPVDMPTITQPPFPSTPHWNLFAVALLKRPFREVSFDGEMSRGSECVRHASQPQTTCRHLLRSSLILIIPGFWEQAIMLSTCLYTVITLM